jgi:AGZA family xanthine/uracil permease-like MFS transporter
LLEVFSLPLVGLISLGLIFYTIVARIPLPKNFPGVLAAVLLGTTLYYLITPTAAPKPELHIGFPMPTLEFFKGLSPALHYLPISIPFAIITVIGGINNTESARVAGDEVGESVRGLESQRGFVVDSDSDGCAGSGSEEGGGGQAGDCACDRLLD